MPFILIIVGVLLIIAAFNDAQGTLASELETDAVGYLKWAAAIAAVGGLGYVPGLRTPSRYMLALVLVVLVLNNYKQIIAGFTTGATAGTTPSATVSPSTAYATSPTTTLPTVAEIQGTQTAPASATGQTAVAQQTVATPFGALDPAAFLTAFESGMGGFGGIA